MPRISTLYRTPSRIPRTPGVRYVGRGMRLGTGRTPILIRRAGTAMVLRNPYVRAGAGVVTAGPLALAGLRRFKNYLRQKRERMKIGHSNTATSKRNIVQNSSNNSLSSRTLNAYNLTEIPKTSTNEIDKRQRDICYISGFKICGEIKSGGGSPVLVNYAVVYDKRSSDGTLFPTTSDFFRGSGTERAMDFDTSLSSVEFHCAPLNTDRFVVLLHKRFTLAPNPSTTSAGYTSNNRENYRSFDWWIPLKKQIRFEDGRAQSHVWLLFWCDRHNSPGGTLPNPTTMIWSHKIITYFREPKN